MISSDQMGAAPRPILLSSSQIVSYSALFVLLAIRLPLTDLGILNRILGPAPLPSWAQGIVFVHDQLYYAYSHLAILIVGIVILINRRDLKKLNVDFGFLLLFIWGALVFCRYHFGPIGWAAALLAVYIPVAIYSKVDRLGRAEPVTLRITLVILILFFSWLILLRNTLDLPLIRTALYWMFIAMPPAVVVEEFAFRGLLWMVLKDLSWPDGRIVTVQAILFWLAHTEYLLSDPVAFWVAVPIASLLLGVIVWRTRSISPSTIAHTCINVCWSIIAYVRL